MLNAIQIETYCFYADIFGKTIFKRFKCTALFIILLHILIDFQVYNFQLKMYLNLF